MDQLIPVTGFLLGLFSSSIDIQIGEHVGSNDTGINGLSTHGLRMVQPEDESCLRQKVEWDETCQEPSHAFDNAKKGKNHPISQPLGVFPIVGIHRLERHVGGVDKSDQIHNQLGSSHKGQNSTKQGAKCQKEIDLGITSLFFELFQFVFIPNKVLSCCSYSDTIYEEKDIVAQAEKEEKTKNR
jgi:hypothetical protein